MTLKKGRAGPSGQCTQTQSTPTDEEVTNSNSTAQQNPKKSLKIHRRPPAFQSPGLTPSTSVEARSSAGDFLVEARQRRSSCFPVSVHEWKVKARSSAGDFLVEARPLPASLLPFKIHQLCGAKPKVARPPELYVNLFTIPSHCLEGETLIHLLKSIQREIESARAADTALPIKFWIKQQFAVGVNEVTRALERIPPNHTRTDISLEECSLKNGDDSRKAPCAPLQAILLASDCNPRWLTKHLPALAASRNVPLIFLKDRKKEGSLRLGELDKGNAVNRVINEVLVADKMDKPISLDFK
ncbi:50S ribosomal protein L7Ae [Striga asiatica]|uniref:50S ribosomal protein L7Ae n=1 Tax=Striga asiatica TaxID=4170 RepID=A0A5A7PSD0_STRAF|nr:50S ribosomal protein L7Ae [Striga asiatica]